MPLYDFRCRAHGAFEATVGRGCSVQPCPRCGKDSARELSVPYIAGQTVARSIPDADYRHEAALRASRKSGWDVDRAVRAMRKSVREDSAGNRSVALT